MREILGRRRVTRWARRTAALTCATEWNWPVVPGAALRDSVRPSKRACACPQPDCAVPGAHPLEPDLLAATTDARMVRWWWTQRPTASVILATGGTAPCALSLPAAAGELALRELDRLGVRTGPVVATPTRFLLLVAPYDLEELGELLYAQDWVPSSLRFHGEGGYVPLPPTETSGGLMGWERRPAPAQRGGTPYLPRLEELLDVLVDASTAAPDGGSRLAY
ncbi:bifunctional DNA primase/polymerase [Streptomyces sparsus]